MKKKIIIIVMILLLVFSNTVFGAPNPVKLRINGEVIKTDVNPFIESGRTLVPIRVISENLGLKVEWVEKTEEVIITKEKLLMKLKIGDKNSIANGKTVKLDVAPILLESRTFVPVRFIAENFGRFVGWNEKEWEVIIKDYDSENFELEEVLPILRENKVVLSAEYDGASYIIPWGEEFFQEINGIKMYRIDYTEDHSDHIVTSERYGVDMKSRTIYIYDIMTDKWNAQ